MIRLFIVALLALITLANQREPFYYPCTTDSECVELNGSDGY